VEIILTNNGYQVFNLGIKVPIEEMIKKAIEENADAIGMSGLLVKSTVFMKENIEEIKRHNLNIKVLLGGAALTEGFVKNDCEPYLPGKVFYCSDAFDALAALENTKVPHKEDLKEFKAEKVPKKERKSQSTDNDCKKSNIKILDKVPEPPFLGIKILKSFDFFEVLKYMNKQALFNRRWNYLKQNAPDFEEILKDKVLPEYNKIVEETVRSKLAQMKAVYGFFKCYSLNNSIFIIKDEREYEIKLPRQQSDECLCLSDFIRPKESGEDYIALQVVTVGEKPLEYAMQLKEAGNYKDYFLFHGFFSELAEAMAEFLHKKIRKEWKIDNNDARTIDGLLNGNFRGQRFSFGYASCPDMYGNKILGDLLSIRENIQITLTDSYEMVPEYSTSAIILHHPQARHFVIK
jgi:5-methyltetrahydrofolate--homocysteine methyltransferase